jgi:hypothetical protein
MELSFIQVFRIDLRSYDCMVWFVVAYEGKLEGKFDEILFV